MTTQQKSIAWAPGAFIFVIVMLLVYATGAAKHAQASLALVQSELALTRTQLEATQAGWAHAQEAHLDALGALGDELHSCEVEVDKLETKLSPSHHSPSHDTPVFAQEWHVGNR